PEALLGDRAALDRALAARGGPELVGPVRQRVEEALAELRAPALTVDPNLERPFEKTREQILRALDLLAEKAVGAAARRDQVASRRVEQLREACLPGGRLQERVYTLAWFAGRYGPRLVEAFWEQMKLEPENLQVIAP